MNEQEFLSQSINKDLIQVASEYSLLFKKPLTSITLRKYGFY